MVTGELLIAALPIGDPSDASSRLIHELSQVDVIACEDTRRLKRQLADLGVTTSAKFESYYDANEKIKASKLVDSMLLGQRVMLVSDAGTPLVSDPGYELTRKSIEAGVAVKVLPGPSAAIAALVVSGLPPDRFVFEGFLPKKSGARNARILELAEDQRTVIIYEAARRLARTLTELSAGFGDDRRACVSRELTKTHEQVVRGTLGELSRQFSDEVTKGEVTLVLEGLTRQTRRAARKN